MIGKILRALSGSNDSVPSSEWAQLADSLGLQHRRGKGSNPTRLYGTINDHKVKVAIYRSRPLEIEVDYESGLQDFSLHQRSRNTKVITNREATSTGDAELDQRYQLFSRSTEATAALVSWLTPARRQALFDLDDAFIVTDLDEDELEVRLRHDSPTSEELRLAIDACVSAAETFDRSAPR